MSLISGEPIQQKFVLDEKLKTRYVFNSEFSVSCCCPAEMGFRNGAKPLVLSVFA